MLCKEWWWAVTSDLEQGVSVRLVSRTVHGDIVDNMDAEGSGEQVLRGASLVMGDLVMVRDCIPPGVTVPAASALFILPALLEKTSRR